MLWTYPSVPLSLLVRLFPNATSLLLHSALARMPHARLSTLCYTRRRVAECSNTSYCNGKRGRIRGTARLLAQLAQRDGGADLGAKAGKQETCGDGATLSTAGGMAGPEAREVGSVGERTRTRPALFGTARRVLE